MWHVGLLNRPGFGRGTELVDIQWGVWGDPAHIIWNAATLVVCVAALVAVFLPRSRALRRGGKSKAVWIIALLATVIVEGYAIPIGPIAVLWFLNKWWKEADRSEATESKVTSTAV